LKILAVVIAYYPDVKSLRSNINKFLPHIDKLIIWDNTPILEEKNYQLFDLLNTDKVIRMGEGCNRGIAFALNKVYDWMLGSVEGYTHLLTMDQDSEWLNFGDYLKVISNTFGDAIFSPNVNKYSEADTEIFKVNYCITSGAIFPADVLKRIGRFNEEYSVDCVDYDFCFKAHNYDIPIFKVGTAHLNQIFGKPLSSTFFGMETQEYSPKRLYFIVRNHLLLWRDYPKHVDGSFRIMIVRSYILGKFIKILLFEKRKVEKIYSLIMGFFSGVLNYRKRKY
jgi:rhamnosyltransferase